MHKDEQWPDQQHGSRPVARAYYDLEISANGQIALVMAAEPPFVLHADTCLINGRLIAGSQPDR
ncbi:hypothetical protein [Pseudomonas sp. F8002]|jgi:hypothetical protein|uniref:hypothetical protein n=1 Tax=Pseudomonas sp. F8002 TaxID=2738822 RepID=UPI0015A4BFD7|nr:hypothetical protein [Pseudomonas sp. F8002]NWB55160.1 hypothetical protein [Pseudomonas sp. F8002]